MRPPIVAFSAEQVCRLTGLSERQLSYWDKTGFFAPQYASEKRHVAFGRVYSFQDVVGLRVITILRKDHDIPLQTLRRIGEYLSQRENFPWARITFYVIGREVFYDDSETGIRMSALRPGQSAIPIPMARISAEMSDKAEKLRHREENQFGRVIQNRYLMHNEPVLAGTRIPTLSVWNFHVAGYSDEDILYQYPSLTKRDVVAAIEYERSRQQRKAG